MELFGFFITGLLLSFVIYAMIHFSYISKIEMPGSDVDGYLYLRRHSIHLLLILGSFIFYALTIYLVPKYFSGIRIFTSMQFPVYLSLFFVKMSVIWFLVSALQINKNHGKNRKPNWLRISIVLDIGMLLCHLGFFFFFSDVIGVTGVFLMFGFITRTLFLFERH